MAISHIKSKLFVYKDKKGEWRWRLIAKNGNVLADSGEGYKRRGNCIAGADAAYRTMRDLHASAMFYQAKQSLAKLPAVPAMAPTPPPVGVDENTAAEVEFAGRRRFGFFGRRK